MKVLPASIAGIAALALIGGCSTPSANQTNHWRIESVGPRITYHLTGYDGTKDGTGWQYTKAQGKSFGKTLQRRLLNHNPDNPLTNDP